MSNYLVVAHQTAASPGLLKALKATRDSDQAAEFVLLVPATPVEGVKKAFAADSHTHAETVATRATYFLGDGGIRLLRSTIGEDSPLIAIQNEIAGRPDFYKQIIISTLPVDVSHWLSMGFPDKIAATFQLPVGQHYGWDDSMAWMESIE